MALSQINDILFLNQSYCTDVSELTFCKHTSSDGRLDRLLLFNFNTTIHVSLAKTSGRSIIFLELKLSEFGFVFKALIIKSLAIWQWHRHLELSLRFHGDAPQLDWGHWRRLSDYHEYNMLSLAPRYWPQKINTMFGTFHEYYTK